MQSRHSLPAEQHRTENEIRLAPAREALRRRLKSSSFKKRRKAARPNVQKRILHLTLALLCLTAMLSFARLSSASVALRVDEAATRMALRSGQAEVSLAVSNPLAQSFAASVVCELLDTQDIVRASSVREEWIRPGGASLRMTLAPSLTGQNEESLEKFLWYRLRYRITPLRTASAPVGPIEGVISLSEITPDFFDLRVSAPYYARESALCHTRVRAVHPISKQPVAGVSVTAEIKFDKGESVKASGITGADGYAAIVFNMPHKVTSDEADLKIKARLSDFEREAESEIRFDRDARILINTDKPLYQPGQTIHVRALVFNAHKRAAANTPLTLTIYDVEDSLLFRTGLVTTRFGVASADWTIPENTRLGDYRISIEPEDEGFSNTKTSKSVKVSRYDLPNFTVNPKADKPYYLPGQDAEVEVRAAYLFGQPVKRGHVRVVRETERSWNYQEQKWETEEKEEYEGETDDAGQFTARINLAEEHQELSHSSWTQFLDLSYAAYFTDPTTNRTEQRRFDLRITKHAIHIYLVKDNYYQTNGFPTQFYLSASYADGTPAACEVMINKKKEQRSAWPNFNRFAQQFSSAHASPPVNRRVITNRFGVAKVENLTLLGLKDDEEDVSLEVEARDAKGLTGSESIEFEHSDKPQVRVMTEKPLYRKGEAVRALITGSNPEMTVIVDVVRNWRVIRSEIVRLKQGRALFTIPYDEHFKGEVSIVAYYDETDSDRDYDARAARTVLYPNDESLKLDVRLDRSTYRPGEEARADFQVQASDGRPVESALGVLVFDRAVEERARTDAEFGSNGSYGFRYYTGSGVIAGLRVEDFERADRARPLPAGLELVAEVLLAHSGRYSKRIFGSEAYDSDQRKIFSNLVEPQLKPVANALNIRYNRNREYPTDEKALLTLLSSEEVDFKGMRDPWGTPYRTGFGWMHDEDVLDIMSAGADKRFSSPDDFVALRVSRPYFQTLGEKLNRAVTNYHQRTNKYIRDAATFKEELRREGVDFDSLRDKRGKPYEIDFEGTGSEWLVIVKSSHTTDTTDPRGSFVPKEFKVWTARMDYFSEIRERIYGALTMHLQATMRAPLSEAEVFDALHRAGFTDEELRDPWGRRFQITVQSWVQNTDRVSILHRARYGEPLTPHVERTPVSRQFYFLTVRSSGKDGRVGTTDDFNVTTFYRTTYELDFLQPAQPQTQSLAAKPNTQAPHIPGRTGNLQGVVFDPNRAVIPGATVRVINTETGVVRETTTNDEGFYRIVNLLPGERYSIEANAPGFLQTIVEGVPVRAWAENNLDFYMAVGAVGATVMVTAESPLIQSTQSQLSTTYTVNQLTELPFNGSIDNLALLTPGTFSAEFGANSGGVVNVITKSGTSRNYQPDGQKNLSGIPAEQISTPRLREYFPETLVWQPLLETDASGRAQLAFKLADNITTWKMSVISSTFDGEIGVAEREIQSFQPFFVEHDPPRILTEGDQIQLPVVLRNYLADEQAVRVEMKPESWFSLLGPAELTEKVAAGDATRAVFGFRAAASVKDGKQRITATGADASDAIEKPVSVHPDGEEVNRTFSHLMTETATFDVNFPGDAVTGSTSAELKIYPNLMAHIIEGIEGIMQRPYGCGEQTVSSTYPSLLALRAYKASGASSPVSAKAERFLRVGYERLLNYRSPGGGFSYWGRGDANLALSAYALRFLNDAREFTPVDESALKETREWLIKQQTADGSWNASDYGTVKKGTARAQLTAYIARVLAVSQLSSKQHQTAAQNPVAASLTRALNYLQPEVERLDEPYLIAAYALAAIEANEPQRAAQAVTRLRALAQHEGEMSFWSSETGTPFYGWGLAGRIETTALAVQALTRFYAPATNELPERGLAYLLSKKDRYGVWYSTQATVNVHDALIKAMANIQSADSQAQEDRAEIFVNEQSATSVTLPPAGQLSAPIAVDLSPYLAAGNNRVQIRRAAARGLAALQIVETYYLPWNSPAASIANPNAASRTLRLAVRYDKTETEIGAQVTCRVEATRTNLSGGYGMMLAEIGLPPGADVDRASLEEAMKESGWSLSRYDVLPDKLIVYLWPQTGGTRFEFKFRARYGLTAQTAPSVLYDYYNPEARTVIAPTRFTVR